MYRVKRNDYVEYQDRFSLRAKDLSKEQRTFLQNLNKRLMKLEELVYKEFESLSLEGDKRITDPADWVEDYELECDFTFILKEDDSKYDPDNDNILVILQENGKDFYKDHEFGIMDGIDHKTSYYPEETDMDKANYHCWLYHNLYDHTELGWVNILRIGKIYIDINMTYQKFQYLTKEETV